MGSADVAYAVSPKPSTFDYFTERYYHQYVVKNCKGIEGNNCRLLIHSNGICVLCLDETHVAVKAARSVDRGDLEVQVTSVVFGSGRGNSRLSSGSLHVVGKRKKQAALCQVDTKICIITLSNGAIYHIPACVDGFVLELNQALQKHPDLLLHAPTAEGYIALISPNYSKVKLCEFTKLSAPTGGDIVEEEEEPQK